jgi:hypothetical protein
MSEAQLVRTIKAHIERGDKAAEKSEQHYIAAGQHLKTLKAQHGGPWDEWETLLKTKIGIGKSRASELMQIADGRKTVERVRSETAERTAKARALQSSPLRSGENGGDPEASAEAMEANFAALDAPDAPEVAAPEEIKSNIFDTIERQKAVARAYKKVFAVSSLDQASKDEVSAAIGTLITAWQSLQRGLAPRPTKPITSDDDGLDIPEYLRRAPKAAAQ